MSPRASRRTSPSRGGRGGAEPRACIVDREQRVWDGLLRGLSQRAIAAELGISQAAVSKIQHRLAARHEAALAGQARHRLILTAARLQYLYAESLRGYARSQEDEVCKTQRRTGDAAGGRDLTEVRVRTRPGDARYLREAREALLALQELQPPPSRPETPSDLSHLTDAQFDALDQLLRPPSPSGPSSPGGAP